MNSLFTKYSIGASNYICFLILLLNLNPFFTFPKINSCFFTIFSNTIIVISQSSFETDDGSSIVHDTVNFVCQYNIFGDGVLETIRC